MKSWARERRKKAGANRDGILPVYTLQASAPSSLCILRGARTARSVPTSGESQRWSPVVVCLAQRHWVQNSLSLSQRTSFTSSKSTSALRASVDWRGHSAPRTMPHFGRDGKWISPIYELRSDPAVVTFGGWVHDTPLSGGRGVRCKLQGLQRPNDIRDVWATCVHLNEWLGLLS